MISFNPDTGAPDLITWLGVLFWLGVAFVAFHFVHKYW